MEEAKMGRQGRRDARYEYRLHMRTERYKARLRLREALLGNPRAIVAILLSVTVAFSVSVMAFLAVLDVLFTPTDMKLSEAVLSLAKITLTSTIGLIGVYLGMSASQVWEKNMKQEEAE